MYLNISNTFHLQVEKIENRVEYEMLRIKIARKYQKRRKHYIFSLADTFTGLKSIHENAH